MPKKAKNKNKLFPTEIQKLIFEYVETPQEIPKIFNNEDNEWCENNMLDNAMSVVLYPSEEVGRIIYSHESKARRCVAYATAVTTGLVLTFTAAPVVALGTGLRDLCFFAKSKHKGPAVKELKELFDANLVKRLK